MGKAKPFDNIDALEGIVDVRGSGSKTLDVGNQPFLHIGHCYIGQRLDSRSRMSGDAHVRICESLGVKSPRATRLVVSLSGKPDLSGMRLGRKDAAPITPCVETRAEGIF